MRNAFQRDIPVMPSNLNRQRRARRRNRHQGRHPVDHESNGQVHVAITFWLFNT